MPDLRSSYQLNQQAIVSSVGAGVFCLDLDAIGRTYRLYPNRPDASLNLSAHTSTGGAVEWRAGAPDGSAVIGMGGAIEAPPSLIMVRIDGPIEQRAGYHGDCGGWSDGHDAVAERLCAAFAQGDVLLVIDSPGGAAAGLQQGVAKALAAKVANGRRCTVFGDEKIGSAAMWWGACLGDEILGVVASEFGSIGARGEHTSIAGMLAREGIVKTYFADPPDKVALAPEFPLGPIGEARGNRDVKTAADAFRAAICASPIGVRNGLTPEYLFALGADMLTGQAAVDAGLCDSIAASLDEVTAYALALVGSEPGTDAMSAKITGAAGAKGEAMSLRAKGDKPDRGDGDGGEPDSDRGTEIPTKCPGCGVENEKDAKFCKGCGESMATKPLEEDPPPPSSKPAPGKPAASVPEKMSAPAALSPTASLASILGAAADTPIAIKTAAIEMRRVVDTAIGVTGKSGHADVIGALLAMPHRLANGKQARDDLAALQASTDATMRKVLVDRLVATGAIERTKIVADVVNAAGVRTGTRVRTKYTAMDLAVLAGLVTDLEKDAPRRNPFEPSRERAEAANADGAAKPMKFSDAAKKTLERHPTIIQIQRRGSSVPAAKLVEGLIATEPQSAQAFLAQNGSAA